MYLQANARELKFRQLEVDFEKTLSTQQTYIAELENRLRDTSEDSAERCSSALGFVYFQFKDLLSKYKKSYYEDKSFIHAALKRYEDSQKELMLEYQNIVSKQAIIGDAKIKELQLSIQLNEKSIIDYKNEMHILKIANSKFQQEDDSWKSKFHTLQEEFNMMMQEKAKSPVKSPKPGTYKPSYFFLSIFALFLPIFTYFYPFLQIFTIFATFCHL